MKNLSLAVLVLAVPLLAKEFRLGYVDTERVVARYEKAADAKKEMDEAVRRFETRADSLKSAWEAAKTEFESQSPTLSESGRRQRAAEVERLKRAWESYVNEVWGRGGRIDQRNRELIAPITAQVESAVARIAESEGYAIVLDAAKAPVVYAQPGLDITEAVIEELNREYVPVTPAAKKTIWAVMPISNTNDQAQRDLAGQRVREIVYNLIRDQSGTEMTPSGKVDQQLQDRGMAGKQLASSDVLDVARALDADYAVWGVCSKEERRTRFELSVVDVRLGTVLKTESGESARDEELRERVATVVRVLLASAQKP